MGIIKGDKIIFKACLFQTLKGYTCRIDPQRRRAGMCRHSLCINRDLSVFFCHAVLLKLRLSQLFLQLFLQTCCRRNHCRAGIANRICNKTAVHGKDLRMFGICHH